MRIGLFGGSFDPVHDAHLVLGHAALDQLGLDELRWIPSGLSWQKSHGLAPAADREAMVALAIAGEPRFRLDRCELMRGGPSYTVDTVDELQAVHAAAGRPTAEWFLVIGQDQYAGLHTWHRWRELLQRVTLAVANRAGEQPRPGPDVAAVPHRMVPIAMPPMDTSATDIRQRAAAGKSLAGLVPAPVAGYIAEHRLYRSNPATPRS